MTSLYIWLKFLHLAGLGAFLFGHGYQVAPRLPSGPGLQVTSAARCSSSRSGRMQLRTRVYWS